MTETMEFHPAIKLVGLDLPRPECETDVVPAFDRWVEDGIPDAMDRLFLLDVDDPFLKQGSRRINRRERAIVELISCLRFPPARWASSSTFMCLREQLDRISDQLLPCAAISSVLEKKVASYVLDECHRRTRDPEGLVSFLGGTHLRIDSNGDVPLMLGGTIPLAALIGAVSKDGILLWRLRAMFLSDTTLFDQALTTIRDTVEESLRTGLQHLLREDRTNLLDPTLYIASIRPILGDTIVIETILEGLGTRAALRQGVAHQFECRIWLDLLGELRGWRPEHVRALVHLSAYWSSHPYVCGEILLSVAGDITWCSPRSTAFSTMFLMRHARSLVEAGLTREHADAHERWRRTICLLPCGDAIVKVSAFLDDLPISDADLNCTWECLGDGTKGQWRWEVMSAVGQDSELTQALAEFLFAFTTADSYDDVEPMLAKMMADEGGVAFLEELSSVPDRLTLLRARALRWSLLTRDPAEPI